MYKAFGLVAVGVTRNFAHISESELPLVTKAFLVL